MSDEVRFGKILVGNRFKYKGGIWERTKHKFARRKDGGWGDNTTGMPGEIPFDVDTMVTPLKESKFEMYLIEQERDKDIWDSAPGKCPKCGLKRLKLSRDKKNV